MEEVVESSVFDIPKARGSSRNHAPKGEENRKGSTKKKEKETGHPALHPAWAIWQAGQVTESTGPPTSLGRLAGWPGNRGLRPPGRSGPAGGPATQQRATASCPAWAGWEAGQHCVRAGRACFCGDGTPASNASATARESKGEGHGKVQHLTLFAWACPVRMETAGERRIAAAERRTAAAKKQTTTTI